MGAHGAAVFADDFACDVRAEYRELLEDGVTDAAATAAMLDRYAGSVRDADEGPVFWIALALAQWRCGRLDDRVRDEALATIASGTDLARWRESGSKALAQRAKVLEDAAETLRSPQRARTRIRKIRKQDCGWNVGDIIAYRTGEGRVALLRVCGISDSRYARSPQIEALDYVGDDVPSVEAIAAMDVRDVGAYPSGEAKPPRVTLSLFAADLKGERFRRVVAGPADAPARDLSLNCFMGAALLDHHFRLRRNPGTGEY